MATLWSNRRLAALTRETQEEHPRNGQSRNTSVPWINEDYITQVSEETEGRVTKKVTQEFSRTNSRIFGPLSQLDEFLLNPQIRTHTGTVPGTFWNTNVENQKPNEHRSQDDLLSGIGPPVCQSRHSIDADPDKAPHSVTGFQDEIPYYSSRTSSGKQKKGALQESPTFLQWEHPCVNWSRWDFVGLSTIGD